jgi:hypothetical protein
MSHLQKSKIKTSLFSKRPFIFCGDDPPENATITHMRNELKKAQDEANDFRTKFSDVETQLKELKREKMNEMEQVKSINDDLTKQLKEVTGKLSGLEPLSNKVQSYETFIQSEFENRIASLPEEKREGVKLVSEVAGDPIASLTKLTATISLLGLNTPQQGVITNPTAPNPNTPNPNAPNPDDKKIDVKNLGWGQALKPLEELTGKGKQQ